MLKPGNLEFVVYSYKLNLKLNLNVNLYEGHNSGDEDGIQSPEGVQYSRNTSHLHRYLTREGDAEKQSDLSNNTTGDGGISKQRVHQDESLNTYRENTYRENAYHENTYRENTYPSDESGADLQMSNTGTVSNPSPSAERRSSQQISVQPKKFSDYVTF